MIATLLALSAALIGADPTLTPISQTAPAPAPAPAPAQPDAGVPNLILPGATAAPDCGGRTQIASLAFCVTAPIGAIGDLGEAYIDRFETEGWLHADGRDNLLVMVRRRDGGGCDGLQMLAFYDEDQPVNETSPGYLAFAPIPGNVCAAPAEEPQPQPQPESSPQ